MRLEGYRNMAICKSFSISRQYSFAKWEGFWDKGSLQEYFWVGFPREWGVRERDGEYSLSNGNGNIVDWKSPLPEQVLSHVCEGGRRVDRISAHAIPLQVRCGVSALK